MPTPRCLPENRTVIFHNIGTYSEDDITKKCIDKAAVERVFELKGKDSAVVVFKDAKDVEATLKQADCNVVKRLPKQVFSSVTAVVESSVIQMLKSKKSVKEHSSKLEKEYRVKIKKDVEIKGGFLEVEQCKIYLEEVYKKLTTEEQQNEHGKKKLTKGQKELTGGATARGNTGGEISGGTGHGIRSQVFSSVTAVVESSVIKMLKSKKSVKDHSSTLEKEYAVKIKNKLEIEGGFLEVEQCKIYLEDVYKKLTTEEQQNEHGKKKLTKGQKELTGGATASGNTGGEISGGTGHGIRSTSVKHDQAKSTNGDVLENQSKQDTVLPRGVQPNSDSMAKPSHEDKRGDSKKEDTPPLGSGAVGGASEKCNDEDVNTDGQREYLRHPGDTYNNSIVQIASTNVHIYTGEFRQVQADVIVNPANQNGHNKNMFHAGSHGYLNDLKDVFIQALKASDGYDSIAIHSTVSDMTGLSKSDVSRSCYEAISNFCRKQDCTVVDIYLVDTDREITELIQQHFDSHRRNAKTDIRSTFTKSCHDVIKERMALSSDRGPREDIGDDFKEQRRRAASLEETTSMINRNKRPHSMTSGAKDSRYARHTNEKTVHSFDQNCSNPRDVGQRKNAKSVQAHKRCSSNSRSRDHNRNRDDETHSPQSADNRQQNGRQSDNPRHVHPGDRHASPKDSRKTPNCSPVGPISSGRDSSLSSCDRRQCPHGKSGSEDEHEDENCPICLESFVQVVELPECKHKFCRSCLQHSLEVKKECPVCRMVYGKIYGTQPKHASMTVEYEDYSLPGFDSYGTIVITYVIPSGIQMDEHPHPGEPYKGLRRCGLLPDNTEGNEVHRLLLKAFRQRLIFTVGRSVTTGKDNCVTWNDIHHKTRTDGGPTKFGYPDPDYLARVTADLAAKGIV